MSVATRRQRERQERRLSILDAAEAVFASKGFSQATMDDIAAEAQLSKGTLYLYFKSKDELLMTLASRSIASVHSEFEAIVASELSASEAVRAMLRCQARHLTVRPQMFRIMTGHMASGYQLDTSTAAFENHRRLVARSVSYVATVIERGKRDRSLRSDLAPAQIAVQLWGGLVGILLVRMNAKTMVHGSHFPVDFEHIVDGYIDMVTRGLECADVESTT
ncbi:TetR/AcrR family transcriptional regulator [Haliangium sp.]|uniref:TetR/AcrR family transcriptional regulator n=1 Tax=Haliangium sp. TaxID=2663208 RepID=UPI003D13427B